MSDLDDLLADNAARRARELEQAEQEAAEAADVLDRWSHPNETDAQRQERREIEAERQRLARLGVTFR